MFQSNFSYARAAGWEASAPNGAHARSDSAEILPCLMQWIGACLTGVDDLSASANPPVFRETCGYESNPVMPPLCNLYQVLSGAKVAAMTATNKDLWRQPGPEARPEKRVLWMIEESDEDLED